jgi:ABC-type multidrug transport system fused ATPase/permease subunit
LEIAIVSFLSLILGVIIGCVSNFLINKGRHTNIYIKFMSNPIKYLIEFITCFIIGSQFIISVLNISTLNPFMSTLLSFFSSIIFAWLLTRHSTTKELNEKQKELAIKSYRHSINAKEKIEYIDLLLEYIDLILNECSASTKECQMKYNLYRISDGINNAFKDSIGNIEDWADILSDDLDKINEINSKQENIEDLNIKIQELDPSDIKQKNLITSYQKDIQDIRKDIDKDKKSINIRVRYTIEHRMVEKDSQFRKLKKQIDDLKEKQIYKDINLKVLENFITKREAPQNG